MRIALFSDIHSNYTALNQALREIKDKKIDKIFILGDSISDGHEDNQVIECMMKYADIAINGNREQLIINGVPENCTLNLKPIQSSRELLTPDSLGYIQSLNRYELQTIDNIALLVIHGDGYLKPSEPITSFYESIYQKFEFDICFYGHNHVVGDDVYKDRRYINPGSLGHPSRESNYTYAVFDTKTGKNEMFEIDVDASFDGLYERFIESSYYKDNLIWSSLILDMIKFKDNRVGAYFSIVLELIDNNPLLDFDMAWIESFDIYKERYESFEKRD